MGILSAIAALVGVGFLVAGAFDKHLRGTHSGWLGSAILATVIVAVPTLARLS